jgi:hypothetical protein
MNTYITNLSSQTYMIHVDFDMMLESLMMLQIIDNQLFNDFDNNLISFS